MHEQRTTAEEFTLLTEEEEEKKKKGDSRKKIGMKLIEREREREREQGSERDPMSRYGGKSAMRRKTETARGCYML